MLGPSYEASDGNPVIFYGVTAGILAGAVAGDHASPISDTTVLSSMASQCQLLEHVRTQAPYVLVVVTWSILVGTIPAAGTQAYGNGVAIFLGFLFMLLHTIFTSAKVVNASGRADCFTALYMYFKKDEGLEQLKEDVKEAFENGGFVPGFEPAGKDEVAGKSLGSSNGDDSVNKAFVGNEENEDDAAKFENEDEVKEEQAPAVVEEPGSEKQVQDEEVAQ